MEKGGSLPPVATKCCPFLSGLSVLVPHLCAEGVPKEHHQNAVTEEMSPVSVFCIFHSMNRRLVDIRVTIECDFTRYGAFPL